MTPRRRLLLILLALLAAGLFYLAFRPAPVPVTTATVTRGPLQEGIEQEGMTRVRERYEITAPVTAHLPRLTLEAGDPVKKGEILVELRPIPAPLLDARDRAQAEARIAQAGAQVEAEGARVAAAAADESLARAELDRLRPLAERGDISRSALDQAESRAEQAKATLRAARFSLAAAREELRAARTLLQPAPGSAPEAVPLRSPVTGEVLSVTRESAGVVTAGQPILTVGDPEGLEVAVDLLSSEAVRVAPGSRVIFERWGGEPLEGRVRRVEPAAFTKVSALGVEEQRVWVIVDFTSPREQWRRLGDGYRVEARFILWEAPDVLRVPSSALFREGERWAVFVVEAGRAEKRLVEIGRRGGLEVQLLGGLDAGEEVILHPDDALADGVAVIPFGER